MFKNGYPFVGIVRDLLNIKSIFFFFLLCLLTFLLLFIKKTFIEYEITAFQILDERGQLGLFKMISALQYLSIPAIYLLKFTFIAFFIWVGCFGFGYRVTYSNCWHIVLVAEIVVSLFWNRSKFWTGARLLSLLIDEFFRSWSARWQMALSLEITQSVWNSILVFSCCWNLH